MDVGMRAQRILLAIGDFQKGKRKAGRMVGGSVGKNRRFRFRKGPVLRIKNQKVGK